MREHLDTMPIWEAYRAGCECPLCEIRQKNEAMYIDNFLGASVMEPDTRVEVNQKGFCQRHFAQMFVASNRLGLAHANTPLRREEQLKLSIPQADWSKAHHWLIWHGRKVCHSQNPDCGACPLADCCDYFAKKEH